MIKKFSMTASNNYLLKFFPMGVKVGWQKEREKISGFLAKYSTGE
jgi:hypothetical protein